VTLAARLEALSADFARDVVDALAGATLGELAALSRRDTKPENVSQAPARRPGGGMKRAAKKASRPAREAKKPKATGRAVPLLFGGSRSSEEE
jgi:hypothetical protein